MVLRGKDIKLHRSSLEEDICNFLRSYNIEFTTNCNDVILNDNGNLLEPICEIIRNTNNPTDIRINQSGEAYFDGTNWIVDHNKKIKIELI